MEETRDFTFADITVSLSDAERLSLEKKRGLDQGAAVQFVVKSWGEFELCVHLWSFKMKTH